MNPVRVVLADDHVVVRQGLRACARIYVPSHRLVPLLALWADVRPQRIVSVARPPSSCVVFPASATVVPAARFHSGSKLRITSSVSHIRRSPFGSVAS